jgi:alpha-galactosidase
VGPVLDAIVTKKSASLPMNLPNTGQVAEVPEGAVVECIGKIENGSVSPRDRASAGAATEHLRRIVESQELTVAAAIQGDRKLVMRAMLADPVAGSLPFERVSSMTEEMLAATSRWLPQFS